MDLAARKLERLKGGVGKNLWLQVLAVEVLGSFLQDRLLDHLADDRNRIGQICDFTEWILSPLGLHLLHILLFRLLGCLPRHDASSKIKI